jgi:hypothetical protein
MHVIMAVIRRSAHAKMLIRITIVIMDVIRYLAHVKILTRITIAIMVVIITSVHMQIQQKMLTTFVTTDAAQFLMIA